MLEKGQSQRKLQKPMSEDSSERWKTPEEQSKEKMQSEVYDFTRPDFSFIPKGVHDWRQQGYYLICMSCEIQHAVWIGKDLMMIGIDEENNPIMKTRKELKMA